MNTFEILVDGKVWITGSTSRKTMRGLKGYLRTLSLAIRPDMVIRLILTGRME